MNMIRFLIRHWNDPDLPQQYRDDEKISFFIREAAEKFEKESVPRYLLADTDETYEENKDSDYEPSDSSVE